MKQQRLVNLLSEIVYRYVIKCDHSGLGQLKKFWIRSKKTLNPDLPSAPTVRYRTGY